MNNTTFECFTNNCHVFFGRADDNLNSLERNFPDYNFLFLKQVHGSKVVQAAKDHQQQADAHWSSQPQQALCIVTADCLPVMFTSPLAVVATHAGWRGLEQNILANSLKQLVALGCPLSKVRVFIGPHIQCQSFEVREDVIKPLQAAYTRCQPQTHGLAENLSESTPQAGKWLADLGLLARAQLLDFGLNKEQINAVGLDTFSDHTFNSYRRDGKSSGRQISFVTRLAK